MQINFLNSRAGTLNRFKKDSKLRNVNISDKRLVRDLKRALFYQKSPLVNEAQSILLFILILNLYSRGRRIRVATRGRCVLQHCTHFSRAFLIIHFSPKKFKFFFSVQKILPLSSVPPRRRNNHSSLAWPGSY